MLESGTASAIFGGGGDPSEVGSLVGWWGGDPGAVPPMTVAGTAVEGWCLRCFLDRRPLSRCLSRDRGDVTLTSEARYRGETAEPVRGDGGGAMFRGLETIAKLVCGSDRR